jgi:hypothetical protein
VRALIFVTGAKRRHRVGLLVRAGCERALLAMLGRRMRGERFQKSGEFVRRREDERTQK